MNYEKKYKETLERAKKLYENANGMILKKWVEQVFPELKESKDEKIRKALKQYFVNSFQNNGVAAICGVHVKDALDRLERQGEHANFRNKIQVGDKVTRNEDGILVNLSQLERVARPSEKQCEQKFEMKTAEESLGIDSDTYNKIVDECILGEQKPKENKGNIGGISPTWSEEDERYICQLESMVKERWTLAEKAQDEGVIKNMSNLAFFLKTLNPNKKPTDEEMKTLLRTEYEKGRADTVAELHKEWSEEDENILGDIIEDVKTLRSSKTLGVIRKKINWLKSLRPQPQWKPSDEHIGLLQAIINEPNNAASESCQIVLKDILEQLKKLKEGKV